MAWVIAETQKDVRRFWNAFNTELQNKLEEVTRLEKKVEEVHAKLREEAGKVEAKPSHSGAPGVFAGLSLLPPALWKSLPGGMVDIVKGVAKLPGAMHKELSGSAAEIVKGLKFAFLAAGWVMLETAWIVIKDVAAIAGPGLVVKAAQRVAKTYKAGSVVYRFTRPVANPSAKAKKHIGIAEQIASAGATAGNAAHFYFTMKETAERIAAMNIKIKRLVYGKD